MKCEILIENTLLWTPCTYVQTINVEKYTRCLMVSACVCWNAWESCSCKVGISHQHRHNHACWWGRERARCFWLRFERVRVALSKNCVYSFSSNLVNCIKRSIIIISLDSNIKFNKIHDSIDLRLGPKKKKKSNN